MDDVAFNQLMKQVIDALNHDPEEQKIMDEVRSMLQKEREKKEKKSNNNEK